MQLVLERGKIIATHDDTQDIVNLYPGCEIIHGEYGSPLEHIGETEVKERFDPRTNEEKSTYYKEKRRQAYPKIEDQLDMMYWDALNNTTTWIDAITEIKNRFPKPVKERT